VWLVDRLLATSSFVMATFTCPRDLAMMGVPTRLVAVLYGSTCGYDEPCQSARLVKWPPGTKGATAVTQGGWAKDGLP
jgi:hypothetical protein